MNPHKSFIYLIKISVGPKNISVLVKNTYECPDSLLSTMAKEIITKYINESYPSQKQYQVQTSQQYFDRMIKQSSFDIEDLNEIEVYDLNLKFREGIVVNRSPEEKQTAKEIIKEKKNGNKKAKTEKQGVRDVPNIGTFAT